MTRFRLLSRLAFSCKATTSAIAIISERYKGKNVSKPLAFGVLQRLLGQLFWTFGVSLFDSLCWQAAFFSSNQYSNLTFISLICAIWIYDGSSGGKTPGCQDGRNHGGQRLGISSRCGGYRLVQCHDHRSDSKLVVSK